MTGGWFVIHLWQLEKSQGISMSFCPQNFPPKKRDPAKSRGTYRWRRRCSSRKNENRSSPDDHFQLRGGRKPRDRGHANGTIQKLSTVAVDVARFHFASWVLGAFSWFVTVLNTPTSWGMSWELPEAYKASVSILLRIKMDFDPFRIKTFRSWGVYLNDVCFRILHRDCNFKRHSFLRLRCRDIPMRLDTSGKAVSWLPWNDAAFLSPFRSTKC